MSTRCLLTQGASKVLDEKNEIIGFALVEGTSNGQTQRWLLRRKPESFSVVAADLDVSLLSWKAMVSKPAPDAERWGANPEEGLWLPDAIYVVANSVVYSYGTGGERSFLNLPLPLPEPSFALQVEPEPSANDADRQLDLGGYHIFQRLQHDQFDREVGRACGYGRLTKPGKSDVWTTTEYWVLSGAYEPAGAQSLITYLGKANDIPSDADPAELHSFLERDWSSGCTLEVTGCNNYQGRLPPPEEAL